MDPHVAEALIFFSVLIIGTLILKNVKIIWNERKSRKPANLKIVRKD
jgi:uncharacterized membrane protein